MHRQLQLLARDGIIGVRLLVYVLQSVSVGIAFVAEDIDLRITLRLTFLRDPQRAGGGGLVPCRRGVDVMISVPYLRHAVLRRGVLRRRSGNDIP